MHKGVGATGLQQMAWQFWLPRVVISGVALVLFWFTAFGTSNQLPFTTADCTLEVCTPRPLSSTANVVLFRPEDRIVLADQPFLTRALLLNGNVPSSSNYTLWIQRGAKRVRVSLHSVVAGSTSRIADKFLGAFALAFGLLLLWRGQTAVSRGLAIFALTTAAHGLIAITLPPPWNLVVGSLYPLIGGPVAFIGLYITAIALTRPEIRRVSRSPAFLAYLGNLILLALSEFLPALMILAKLEWPIVWTLVQMAPIAFAAIAWAVPVMYLILGYRHSAASDRLRIRWFIASLSLVLPLMALNVLLNGDRGFSAFELYVLQAAKVVAGFAIFAILSYAALTQRLVAVRFVINRALVFAALTAGLVGALSLVESLIEQSIVSRDTGLALNLLVPLLLGVFINRIHRFGEDSVERLVFRKEYHSRSQILTFVRDAGFISQPATLYQRTAEIFASHGGGSYAGLFLASEAGYERAAASGQGCELPLRVEVDDEAMVRLRATLAPLDLATVSSALGNSGQLLPLAMRGRLEGVLVCGAKAEGRYAQAEIDFLEKAAAGIIACVIALRAELHANFVTQIAEGALPPDQVVGQARRLAEA